MADLILNCDLGEGETPEQTATLMRCIGAANIACGGHAGNEESIRACLGLCLKHGVLPGAHPGLAADFGRGEASGVDAKTFKDLVEEQLARFDQAAGSAGGRLHHVKLHGSLYHAVEKDGELAEAYLRVLKKRAAVPAVFCLAGGAFARRARAEEIEVWEEAFADRGYAEDGTLLPRGHPEALVEDPCLILARLELLVKKGEIMTQGGAFLPCRARTLCVHGDTPGVLELFRVLAEEAEKAKENR